MNYMWLTIGWVLYFTLHSVLAADGAKGLVISMMGSSLRWYRLFYSVFSTGALIVLVFYGATIPAAYFFERTELLRYVSLVFTTFGVMTIRLAFKQFQLKSFVGFTPETGSTLKREGILKRIRHPILSGIILITLGYFIFIPNLPTLVSCLCILGYLPMGVWLEEKKLIKFFGEEYLQYKREVPAFIPKIKMSFGAKARDVSRYD
jgi:protein-S-isoprenylcysteine O-methyltransferase Ste14